MWWRNLFYILSNLGWIHASAIENDQLSFANELVGRPKGSLAPEVVPEHHSLGDSDRVVMYTVEMKVVVKDKTLNSVFTLVLMLMVIINTVNMGSQGPDSIERQFALSLGLKNGSRLGLRFPTIGKSLQILVV